jgi:PAS domain S-box-containing protein
VTEKQRFTPRALVTGILALNAVGIGASAIMGWALDIPALKSVIPGLTTMKANTAFGSIASGLALFMLNTVSDRSPVPIIMATLLAFFTLTIGGLTLIEYATGVGFGIDQFAFADPNTTSLPFPGRMAPATAIGFITSAASIILLAVGVATPGVLQQRCVAAAHMVAFCPASIAYVGLAGYVYDVPGLYRFGPFVSVALNTAIVFAVLVFAVLCILPGRGWLRPFGATPVARKVLVRLVPVALIVPFVTGSVIVFGAKLKFYDALFSPALFALASAATVFAIVRYAAGAVRRAELKIQKVSAALAANETLLNISQNAAQVGSWEWDIQTNFVQWSDEQYRLSGIDPADVPVVTYETWQNSLHPADRDRLSREVANVLDNGHQGFEQEFRLVIPQTAGGGERWVLARANIVRDEHGTPLRMIGVNFDITARKKTGALLNESDEKLRLLINRTPAAIAMFDRNMHYLAVSQRFVLDYGLDRQPDELPGLSHYDLFPEIPDRWRAIHHRVLAGETLSADEDRFERADGTNDWIRWEMLPWQQADGSVGGAIMFSEVVTERVDAQRALADSETLLRATFDAAPVGVMLAERASGAITYHNSAACRIMRLQGARGMEHMKWEAYHLDGQRVAPDEQPLARTLATGEPAALECQFSCGDGVRRWLSFSTAPIKDETGEMIAIVKNCVDIDAAKRAEALLARSAADLEDLVQERTEALRKTQNKVAHLQRMEALGQLAGGIAHDFNNVLHAVHAGTALIEKRANDEAGVRQLAAMVAESAARGSAITRRLLDFSRRSELRTDAVDARALLVSLREMLSHTLGIGIAITIDTQSDLPAMVVDKAQLETVIVNLAGNARDAMEHGGTLTLAASFVDTGSTDHALPAGLTNGAYICLAISDTGIGMPPELLARVAEPFFTTKAEGKGTGLGLAMARDFADQSNGALEIRSEPGRGTTVNLWIPATVAA